MTKRICRKMSFLRVCIPLAFFGLFGLDGCTTVNPQQVPEETLSLREVTGRVYDLKQLSVIPHVIHTVLPMYPVNLRKAGVTGNSMMQFVITRDGFVANIKSLSSTNTEFADAAAKMLSAWKFKPGMIDGVPVNVLTSMPVTFNLSETP